ncbi:MAG: beta-ketoacyl-[acyl-carrier-protein] synthase family protein [Kofleriaceae bacterium]
MWGTSLDTYEHHDGALVQQSAGTTFHRLAIRLAAPRRMIALACATGTAAIGEAFRLVRAGRIDACVAGGSCTMLGAFYLIGFHALRAVAADLVGEPPDRACKPFDRERRGFALSDGAGALVIESLASARRRGAEPLAELRGYGVSQDAYDLNRPPGDGAGARRCIEQALADAGLAASALDAVNAHGTGTQIGDLAETAALRAVLGDRAVPVSSCKGALGHAMAAAGALEMIAAIGTCRTGLVPATRNLVEPDPACAADHVLARTREAGARTVLKTSFGMGGQNAALVVGRFDP